MEYKEFKSTEPSYIHRMWSHETSLGLPFTYYSTADAYCKLIFHYKGTFITQAGTPSPHAALQAQTKYASFYTTRERFGIFGVTLYPYAIPALFGVPANMLSNQVLDLRSLARESGQRLADEVLEATTNDERAEVVTRFVAHHTQPLPMLAGAMHAMFAARGDVEIGALANEYALSRRQFERAFKHLSGFTPALYARIVRFQAFVDDPQSKDKSPAEIAHSLGYYDQSHFVNEFKMFSGYPPTRYFDNATSPFFSNTKSH